MKVGAGQYMSNRVAITILPMIPPSLAATMDTATPVALENEYSTVLLIRTRILQQCFQKYQNVF
jgi:hypothetical protein